jgi:hypothetical protein
VKKHRDAKKEEMKRKIEILKKRREMFFKA